MTIRYMATELASLIQELPDNNYDRFYKFKALYEEVQANSGSIVHQIQDDSSEESGSEGEDEEYSLSAQNPADSLSAQNPAD